MFYTDTVQCLYLFMCLNFNCLSFSSLLYLQYHEGHKYLQIIYQSHFRLQWHNSAWLVSTQILDICCMMYYIHHSVSKHLTIPLNKVNSATDWHSTVLFLWLLNEQQKITFACLKSTSWLTFPLKWKAVLVFRWTGESCRDLERFFFPISLQICDKISECLKEERD